MPLHEEGGPRSDRQRATIVPCSPSVSWRSTEQPVHVRPRRQVDATRAVSPGRSVGLVVSLALDPRCAPADGGPSCRRCGRRSRARLAGTRTARDSTWHSDASAAAAPASSATGAGSPQPRAGRASSRAAVSERQGAGASRRDSSVCARPHAPPPGRRCSSPWSRLLLRCRSPPVASSSIEVAATSPQHTGAELFQQRCAGCHTFEAAATQGGSTNVRTRERTDGPNFNTRRECVERVLYAIRERRLLGRDHAAEHRRRRAGETGRRVRRALRRRRTPTARVRDGIGSEANGFHCTGTSAAAATEIDDEQ